VKNKIKKLSVLILAAIYCFAIGFVTKSLNYSDFGNKQQASQESSFTVFSSKLFCHTSQSESSVNIFNNLPASSFKNPFSGLWAISNTTEQLFKTAFSQYANIARNFLIQHRKTDIIFPFHYFW
jgi:hypothetical protein